MGGRYVLKCSTVDRRLFTKENDEKKKKKKNFHEQTHENKERLEIRELTARSDKDVENGKNE